MMIKKKKNQNTRAGQNTFLYNVGNKTFLHKPGFSVLWPDPMFEVIYRGFFQAEIVTGPVV